VITNKELKIPVGFPAKTDAANIVMVNGGLMAKPAETGF
jgi:hypothetical protein